MVADVGAGVRVVTVVAAEPAPAPGGRVVEAVVVDEAGRAVVAVVVADATSQVASAESP